MRSFMPHSVIMRRATLVAWRMSPATPLLVSSVNISSAIRPPNAVLMKAMHHLRPTFWRSFSGRLIVAPPYGPRGMIVTLWIGSACSSRNCTTAWPASW